MHGEEVKKVDQDSPMNLDSPAKDQAEARLAVIEKEKSELQKQVGHLQAELRKKTQDDEKEALDQPDKAAEPSAT